MATIKKSVKKAQKGAAEYKSQWGKKTADSTKYYNDKAMDNLKAVMNLRSHGASAKDTEGYQKEQRQALKDRNRQRMKGTPGYDKNGFPVTKQKTGGKVKKAQGGAKFPFDKLSKDTTSKKLYPSGDLVPSSPNYKGPKGKPSMALKKSMKMKKGGKISKKK